MDKLVFMDMDNSSNNLRQDAIMLPFGVFVGWAWGHQEQIVSQFRLPHFLNPIAQSNVAEFHIDIVMYAIKVSVSENFNEIWVGSKPLNGLDFVLNALSVNGMSRLTVDLSSESLETIIE
jgi:hypothetical protein